MGYSEERRRILNYVTDNGKIIELTPNKDNVKCYYRELEMYPDLKKLAIRYPGYKTTNTKCDYCVCLVDRAQEQSLSTAFYKGFSFEQLTDLMFYIALQEDINYPNTYYQGRKMCFYRYLEAIYCKISSKHSLQEAITRATAHGYIPGNWTDVGELYDKVAMVRRQEDVRRFRICEGV